MRNRKSIFHDWTNYGAIKLCLALFKYNRNRRNTEFNNTWPTILFLLIIKLVGESSQSLKTFLIWAAMRPQRKLLLCSQLSAPTPTAVAIYLLRWVNAVKGRWKIIGVEGRTSKSTWVGSRSVCVDGRSI